MAPALIGLMAVGVGMQVMGTLQAGKETQEIANARASVDMLNAKYARANAAEQAKIQGEKGQRFMATQKADFAAAGIKVNEGVPLVVAAQTNEDIHKDIGFTLMQGEQQYNLLRSSAGMERAIGAMEKRQSVWNAISTGIGGFGSMAYMGYQAGMFKPGITETTPLGRTGPTETGYGYKRIFYT